MYDVGYGIIHTIFCVTSMISLVENEIVNKQKFLSWDDRKRNRYRGEVVISLKNLRQAQFYYLRA